jgi:hypothetical protein
MGRLFEISAGHHRIVLARSRGLERRPGLESGSFVIGGLPFLQLVEGAGCLVGWDGEAHGGSPDSLDSVKEVEI